MYFREEVGRLEWLVQKCIGEISRVEVRTVGGRIRNPANHQQSQIRVDAPQGSAKFGPIEIRHVEVRDHEADVRRALGKLAADQTR